MTHQPESDLVVTERCRELIEKYWRSQGKFVSLDVKPVPIARSRTAGTSVYAIRSDMVGGMPR